MSGDYHFPRFGGKLPFATIFKSAWELDAKDNKWKPRIIKMASLHEKWQTLNLRQQFPAVTNLEELQLVDVKMWGCERGPRQSGVILPRYAGVLSEFTNRITAPPALVLQHLNQISVALQAIHSIGQVHCDVKPSNIFLNDTCNAFLADFGSMTPYQAEVQSRTMAYCVAEHLADRIPAHPVMDWASLVITGLQLLRKIVITEKPVNLEYLSRCVDSLRSDIEEPAHLKIVEIFDTHVGSYV